MKNFTLLFSLLLTLVKGYSQCDAVSLPYFEDVEQATAPNLPDCMGSGYITFASTEVFKTTSEPVSGFSGNVLVYNTALLEGIPKGAGTGVTLSVPNTIFASGTHYTLSYKYGMSNINGDIGLVRIMLVKDGEYTYLSEQENVVSGAAATYTTAPFTVTESGSYWLTIEIQLEGDQGYLYMDDIAIQEAPAASINLNEQNNSMSVYPNPTQNEIHITNANGVSQVLLYTITGQEVLAKNIKANTAQNDIKINTEALSAGVYLLQTISATGNKSFKVVKQ